MSALSLSDLSSPKKMKPSPSSRLASKWSPSIGNQIDQTQKNEIDADAFNVGKKIDETMSSVCQMMENVNVYSKNIGLTAKDITPPRFVSKDSYQHSPFGKQLRLTDYSPYTSPAKAKSPLRLREENPRLSTVSFIDNISDSGDDEIH